MKAPCLPCKNKELTIEAATVTVERLMAENTKLREASKMLDTALCVAYPDGCYHGEVVELWNAARAALEKRNDNTTRSSEAGAGGFGKDSCASVR